MRQVRGHHSGAGICACAGLCHEAGADLAEGSSAGGQSQRPRRQGYLHGGKQAGSEALMTHPLRAATHIGESKNTSQTPPTPPSPPAPAADRIEARFNELKAKHQSGFVSFITCGDPDLETSAKIL